MESFTFIVSLVAAVLGGASLVLHVVAPRTKNTVDDTVLNAIDEILAFIRQEQEAKATTSSRTTA